METSPSSESLLANDVEALRLRYANTQELYREVCAVMFFRYGITPTANRLYQLVRKGSMSAPAEALARFWSELRERSRVTIDGADLPEALRVGAGELVTSLWKVAQEAAAASLAVFRAEAEARAKGAGQAQAAADARAAALADELAACQAALHASEKERKALRHQLGTSEALNATLRERIDESRRELNEQHAWFKTVERDHAAALDKLRTQWHAERDAGETAQRQAAHDLERELAATARLQHALDTERQGAAAAAERHRAELRETLSQVGQLHQRIGTLEGSAAAATAARDHAREELAACRRELAAAQAQQAASVAGLAAAMEAALGQGPAAQARGRAQSD